LTDLLHLSPPAVAASETERPRRLLTPPDVRWGDRYLLLLGAGLAGYALLGKGFAYIGFPPIFMGEILLLAGMLACLAGRGCWRAVAMGPAWPLLAFMVWGACRTLPYVNAYGLDSLRDGMTWGYATYALVVAALLVAVPRRLAMIRGMLHRAVPLFLLLVSPLLICSMQFDEHIPRWPWADVPVLLLKGGDNCVLLAGAFAWLAVGEDNVTSWLPVLLFPPCLMLNIKGRGGVVALLASIMLVTIFRPMRTMVVRFWGILIFGLLLLWATNLRIASSDGDRDISFDRLIANFTSIVGDSSQTELAGSKEWRLKWWREIYSYTIHGPYFWSGKGFGINLADDDGFQVNEDRSLRNPHNGHLTILARAGVPGLLLWAFAHLTWAYAMIDGLFHACRRNDPRWSGLFVFLLAFWLAFMLNAAFDVYIEGPMGGIWLWSVFGLGLGAVWIHKHHPEVLYANEGTARP
jgi:hypothetical protein